MHKCLQEEDIKMCTVCAPVARQTLKKNETEKLLSLDLTAYVAIFSLQLTQSQSGGISNRGGEISITVTWNISSESL